MSKKSKEQSDKPLSNVPPAVLDYMAGYQFTYAIEKGIKKVWFMYPGRKEVLDAVKISIPWTKKDGTPAKLPKVFYVCELCGTHCKAPSEGAKKKGVPIIWVDHKNPVKPIDAPWNWHSMIQNLFCDKSNLQAICTACHKCKTQEENRIRKEYNAAIKNSGRNR